MAKTIKSFKEIENLVYNEVIKIMTAKFYEVFDKTYKEFCDKFYSEYDPSVYPRTYELRDKLAQEIAPYKVGNNIMCGITFDESNLSHDMWQVDKFSGVHHGANDTGARWIVEDSLLHAGHGGYEYTETAPYLDTVDALKDCKEFLSILRSELRKAGFVVK